MPFAVGTSITAANWFTASTSFANPTMTAHVARQIPSLAYGRLIHLGSLPRHLREPLAQLSFSNGSYLQLHRTHLPSSSNMTCSLGLVPSSIAAQRRDLPRMLFVKLVVQLVNLRSGLF